MTEIKQIRAGDRWVAVVGYVSEKGEPKPIITKKGIKTKIAEIGVEDKQGNKIYATLWENMIGKINVGDFVQVIGDCKEYNGKLFIKGRIELLPKVKEVD